MNLRIAGWDTSWGFTTTVFHNSWVFLFLSGKQLGWWKLTGRRFDSSFLSCWCCTSRGKWAATEEWRRLRILSQSQLISSPQNLTQLLAKHCWWFSQALGGWLKDSWPSKCLFEGFSWCKEVEIIDVVGQVISHLFWFSKVGSRVQSLTVGIEARIYGLFQLLVHDNQLFQD